MPPPQLQTQFQHDEEAAELHPAARHPVAETPWTPILTRWFNTKYFYKVLGKYKFKLEIIFQSQIKTFLFINNCYLLIFIIQIAVLFSYIFNGLNVVFHL